MNDRTILNSDAVSDPDGVEITPDDGAPPY
jgi:hypothetical protein